MKRCFTQKVIHVLVTVVTLTSVVMLAPTNQAHAEIDRIDTTFNGVGYVTHNGAAGGNGDDYGYSIAVQADGKYVIAGYSRNAAGNDDMAIWRYNTNGTLDTTFNSVGYVIHNGAAGGNGHDRSYSIVIQPDGKYVVAGYSTSAAGNGDMAIWRYNTNGTLDTAFNSVGYVTHHGAAGGNGSDEGKSVAIQSNGKIIVAGYSYNAVPNADMAIWRYNIDGTLDTTFNSVGYLTHNSAAGGNSIDAGYGVDIDLAGKYVVTGSSRNISGNSDIAIWRITTDGTLDTTFNGVGYVTHGGAAGFNGTDESNSIVVQPDGKYVVAGVSTNAALNNDITAWRYNTDGTLDAGFNGTGFYTHGFSTNGDLHDKVVGYSAIYIDTEGKIYLAGYLKIASTNYDFAIIRLTAGGELDMSFNGKGYYDYPLVSGTNYPVSIAYVDDGKFVLAGNSTVANRDMTIWRFEVLYQTTPPAGLVPKVGSTDVSIGGPDGAYADDTETILYSSNIPIAGAAVDYTEDLDWSGVTGGTDAVNYKSFISGLYGADGVDGTVTLYVPYRDGDDSVGICPGATSLAEVTPTCTGLIGKQESDADTELVTINNVRYWKVTGLTGTGGFSGRGLAETGATETAGILFTGVVLTALPALLRKRPFRW